MLLGVAGAGTDVELWDPFSGSMFAALPTRELVTDLAFAPRGGLLAVGQERQVVLWSVVDSAVQKRAMGLAEVPSSLAFGPDGSLAIGLRGDQPARLWKPDQSPTSAGDARWSDRRESGVRRDGSNCDAPDR